MNNLDSLLEQVLTLVSKNPKDNILQLFENKKIKQKNETKYQNPIHRNYYCSGIFGVGDKRHGGVHNGVDLRIAGGTSVYPIDDGIIKSVSIENKGGNVISIQHANGLNSIYRHMGTVAVYPGQNVNTNTVIGTVGDSGNAKGTAPHIHFEIKENGVYKDPKNYIYVPPYSGKLQPEERLWLSENHKKDAQSFNMKEHLNNRIAFSIKIQQLEKIANIYSFIARKPPLGSGSSL